MKDFTTTKENIKKDVSEILNRYAYEYGTPKTIGCIKEEIDNLLEDYKSDGEIYKFMTTLNYDTETNTLTVQIGIKEDEYIIDFTLLDFTFCCQNERQS